MSLSPPSKLQVAYNPKALVVYSRLNGDCDLIVQDSSSFCAEGEALSLCLPAAARAGRRPGKGFLFIRVLIRPHAACLENIHA